METLAVGITTDLEVEELVGVAMLEIVVLPTGVSGRGDALTMDAIAAKMISKMVV